MKTSFESRHHFREQHAHMKLDLDLDSMTSEDRTRAAQILRRGLKLLQVDKQAKPRATKAGDGSHQDATMGSNTEPVQGPDKGYVDRVVIGCGGDIIARHPRCYDGATTVRT